MTWGWMRFSVVVVALLTVSAAAAEPCTAEAGQKAVTGAAELVARLGVAAARPVLATPEGGGFCGPYAVTVIDYDGTWRIDPVNEVNVGRSVRALTDGAAVNFVTGMIGAARRGGGRLGSYFTTDNEHGKPVHKALFYIDVPSRRVVVYGGFIVEP
ncbi:MAG: hypothetical protein WCJ64_23080 [Rhodospirillaceae bacterium]